MAINQPDRVDQIAALLQETVKFLRKNELQRMFDKIPA